MKDDARPERGGPTEDEDLRDDDFDDGEDEVELSDAQIASYEAARDAFVARLSAALAGSLSGIGVLPPDCGPPGYHDALSFLGRMPNQLGHLT